MQLKLPRLHQAARLPVKLHQRRVLQLTQIRSNLTLLQLLIKQVVSQTNKTSKILHLANKHLKCRIHLSQLLNLFKPTQVHRQPKLHSKAKQVL